MSTRACLTAPRMQQSAAMTSCWVCGSTAAIPFKPRSIERPLTASDLRISDANYGCTLALERCRQCGFLFADGADLTELLQLYEALDDPGYEESQDSRRLQMNWLLDTAARAQPGLESLLDVGAATGLLVSLARQRGWQAEGVEPSQQLVRVAAEHGVQLHQGSIPHPALEGRQFDVVCLVDVIEHVADPLALLRSAAQSLAPGGCLMVVTPDLGSIAHKLLGARWWHFRLAHVGYFDRASFELAAVRAGLTVVDRTRAKWFFRVGYLAERLTRYLPIAGLWRRLEQTRAGQIASQQVVPLNLFDSWVFMCRKTSP